MSPQKRVHMTPTLNLLCNLVMTPITLDIYNHYLLFPSPYLSGFSFGLCVLWYKV